MDPVSAAASIIGIVTLAKDLIELGIKLKKSVELVKTNRNALLELVGRIITSLESLNGCCHKCSTEPPGLRIAFQGLNSELNMALEICRTIASAKTNRLQEWNQRHVIEEKITGIEKRISDCLQIFTTSAAIRIERAVSDNSADVTEKIDDLSRKIDRVMEQVQRKFKEGESNPAVAERLIGTTRLTPSALKISLVEAQKSVAKHSPTSLENQYLGIKIKTLTTALKGATFVAKATPIPVHYSQPSSKTHHANISDPTDETIDTVMEVLRILHSLQGNYSFSENEIATRLDKLSIALNDIGMYQGACEMSAEAVRLFGRLERRQPQNHLATALVNYSNHLSNLGRAKDALSSAKEAVKLYRSLVKQSHDLFQSDLALALNTMSNCLTNVGRPEQALESAQEAFRIYHCLDAEHPQAFKADLAMSLSNVSSRLRDMERTVEALEAAQKSSNIYRYLYEQSPDAHSSEYATSLSTYANLLSDLKRYKDALGHARKVVDIRRGLFNMRPGVFAPSLASSLLDLFGVLRSLNKHKESLEFVEEAVKLYRELAAAHRDRFDADLASSLRCAANCLSRLGYDDQALLLFQDAIICHAELARSCRKKFSTAYAATLDDAYFYYIKVHRLEDALEVAGQAVRIRRDVLDSDWGGTNKSRDLAASLTNVVNCYTKLGKFQKALGVLEETRKLYKTLYLQNPKEFRHDYAKTLYNLSVCRTQRECRDDNAALDAGRKAIDHFRVLIKESPHKYEMDLVEALINVSFILTDLGNHEEALAPSKEAAKISRELKSHATLRRSLKRVSRCLTNLGRHEAAATFEKEANTIRPP